MNDDYYLYGNVKLGYGNFTLPPILIGTTFYQGQTLVDRNAYITENNQPGNINIIEGLKKIGVEKIWIDGGVIDIESFSHILETQQIVSRALKLKIFD